MRLFTGFLDEISGFEVFGSLEGSVGYREAAVPDIVDVYKVLGNTS